jgi:alcohol dehydrogenase (NADP+)
VRRDGGVVRKAERFFVLSALLGVVMAADAGVVGGGGGGGGVGGGGGSGERAGGAWVALDNGAAFPRLGFGTWQAPEAEVEAAVYEALRVGYRHIDCAAVYKNEAAVGRAIQRALGEGLLVREDLFVTSKLWVGDAFAGNVEKALETTLRDLQLEYVDLYLLHWPILLKPGTTVPFTKADLLGYDADEVLRVWREMEAEHGKGKTKALGASNFTVPKLRKLLASCAVRPAVLQVESHPYLQQKGLFEFCAAERVVVTAYSPLGSPARPARLRNDDDPVLLEDPVLVRVAAGLDASPAQVLIAWGLTRGSVIPKSVTPARILQNFQALRLALSPEDLAALDALDRHYRFLRGAIFVKEGETWESLWEDEAAIRDSVLAAKKGDEL